MKDSRDIERDQGKDYVEYYEKWGAEYPDVTYDPSLEDQRRIGGAYTIDNTIMADYSRYTHTSYNKRARASAIKNKDWEEALRVDNFLTDHMLMLPIIKLLGKYPNSSFSVTSITRQLVNQGVIPEAVSPLKKDPKAVDPINKDNKWLDESYDVLGEYEWQSEVEAKAVLNPMENRIAQARRYLRIAGYVELDHAPNREGNLKITDKGLLAYNDDESIALAKLKVDYDRMHSVRESNKKD